MICVEHSGWDTELLEPRSQVGNCLVQKTPTEGDLIHFQLSKKSERVLVVECCQSGQGQLETRNMCQLEAKIKLVEINEKKKVLLDQLRSEKMSNQVFLLITRSTLSRARGKLKQGK